VPVVGMAEASCRLACARGDRFAIVTGGAAWEPMLREFVIGLGLADRLAAIRAIVPTGGEIAAAPAAALDQLAGACRACVIEDGADAVILGGGRISRARAATPGGRFRCRSFCSVEAVAQAVSRCTRADTAHQPGCSNQQRRPYARARKAARWMTCRRRSRSGATATGSRVHPRSVRNCHSQSARAEAASRRVRA